jgi:ABC-2 type transport system ATP-binding protein
VGLAAKRHERVNRLSGGQQRRLDVAIGLSGDPEVLFLDEPTTGFDPGARRNAWQMIRNLSELGKTVFLTTHYMDEAQQLAGRVAIIVAGEIVAEGPPSTLTQTDAPSQIEFLLPEGAASPPAELLETPPVDGIVRLSTPEPVKTLHRLTGWALENGVELIGLKVTRPSLEDVYLELTKESGDKA